MDSHKTQEHIMFQYTQSELFWFLAKPQLETDNHKVVWHDRPTLDTLCFAQHYFIFSFNYSREMSGLYTRGVFLYQHSSVYNQTIL